MHSQVPGTSRSSPIIFFLVSFFSYTFQSGRASEIRLHNLRLNSNNVSHMRITEMGRKSIFKDLPCVTSTNKTGWREEVLNN